MKYLSCFALLALGISGLGGCAAQTTEEESPPAPELAEGSDQVGTQMACYSVRYYENAAYESYRRCTVAHPNDSATACKGALDYWIKWSNLAEAQGCY
jgi:hypothetical protein